MKYILFFFGFCLLALQLKAQSANIDRHTTVKIDQHFTSQQLSAQRLKGFEFRGEQKLTEFANLVALASNTEYELAMRQHAAKLGLALFEAIQADIFAPNQKRMLTAKKFFDSLTTSKSKINFQLSDFVTTKPLTPYKDAYTGTISFKISYNGNKTMPYEADIILLKIAKSFGKTTEYVWEVRIKSIRRQP
jgi:hypothetical protein